MTVGIVLGVGGARGSFELGAVRCLVDEFGVEPSVVSGSSVGAMIAAKLAEGGSPRDRTAGLDRLESFLLGLHGASDLYEPQRWLRDLDGTVIGREIAKRMTPGAATSPDESMVSHALALGTDVLRSLVADIPKLRRALDDLNQRGNSVMSIEPLRRHLGGQDDAGGSEGPLLDAGAVATSGTELRLAVVSLDHGKLRYVDGTGRLRARDDSELDTAVDLIDAVLASAAQPVLFPPVRLGEETYADGGILEIVPLEIAITCGADTIFAIAASALEISPAPSGGFGEAGLLAIARRTTNDIPLWANVCRSLDPPNADGVDVTVIAPGLDVLGVTDIDPGLLSIASDYGFMRAADTVAAIGAPDRARSMLLSDAIAAVRRSCWEIERDLSAAGSGGDGAIARLRFLKWFLWHLARERSTLGVPAPHDVDSWHLRWERHPDPVAVAETPWDGREFETFVPTGADMADPEALPPHLVARLRAGGELDRVLAGPRP